MQVRVLDRLARRRAVIHAHVEAVRSMLCSQRLALDTQQCVARRDFGVGQLEEARAVTLGNDRCGPDAGS